MLGNVTRLLKQLAGKLPWRYGAAIVCQYTNMIFYSPFEENYRKIIMAYLRWKSHLKFPIEGKMPQKSSQE